MAANRRALRTADEIRAAGAAAVADWPPLSERQVNEVVGLLAPAVTDQSAPEGEVRIPRQRKADAA